jgi:hypothetical protein
MYFGWVDRALPILEAARECLYGESGAAVRATLRDHVGVLRAYATTLGQAPVELGLERIDEMFRTGERIPSTWSTSAYYSRYHLNVVEDVVRAVVSDDFALGPTARRWLDDDEYLVRRRIHRDVREHLRKTGLH